MRLKRLSVISLMVALLTMVSIQAQAEEVELTQEKSFPLLDIGPTFGWNNPGGIYGVEADYRVLNFLSVGLAAGNAMWGVRITPQVRLYPFGPSGVMFVELGSSINLGPGDVTATENTQRQVLETDMVMTLNAAIGARISLARNNGWLAFRVGYSESLSDTPFRTTDDSQVMPFTRTVVNALTPGGIMMGMSGGISLL